MNVEEEFKIAENQEEERMITVTGKRRSKEAEDHTIEEKERMKIIYENMNETEQNRYEAFKSCTISKEKIIKVYQTVLQTTIAPSEFTTVLLKAISKVYLGELVEEAKLIMEERGEKGQIKPEHLMEGRRRALMAGILPTSKPKSIFKMN